MALELVGGTLFTLLYDGVKQAMSQNSTFKSLLGGLKSTLDSLVPRDIQQIGEHNSELGLPNEEIESLQMHMQEGVELVQKLSKLPVWNFCCLSDYSDQIGELDRALKRLLERLKMQEARDVKEVLVLARENRDKLEEVNRRLLDIHKLLQQVGGETEQSSESNAGTVAEISQGNGVEEVACFHGGAYGGALEALFGAVGGETEENLGSESNAGTVPEISQGNGVDEVTSFHGGASLEALFGALLGMVVEVKDKTMMFKPLLRGLESTLCSLRPLIEEIAKHNKVLDRPTEELKDFRIQMEKGVELVRKCSKVRLSVICKQHKYTNKLIELDEYLQRLLNMLKVQVARDVKETLVSIKSIETVLNKIAGSGVLQDQIQTKGLGALPESLSSVVGLDMPNMQETSDLKETLVSFRNTKKAAVEQSEGSAMVQNQSENEGRTDGHSRSTVSIPSGSTESQFTKAQSPRLDKSNIDGKILGISSLRVFLLSELKAATRNFRSGLVLGEGYDGRVFKGWLDEKTLAPSKTGTGTAVAIKEFRPGRQEELELVLSFSGRFSHPNLVQLLGYCLEESSRLLVYEYMAKGSLKFHLFRVRSPGNELLTWRSRLRIAIGAARGLAFLHTSAERAMFGSFMTSNILLDGNFNAKISDFGLGIRPPAGVESDVSTRVMAVYGYAAPEYISHGLLSMKSDVYGFGVVLLELLTGLHAPDRDRPKEQHNLVEWAKPLMLHKRNFIRIMDTRMEGQYSIKAALQVAQITRKCLAPDPKDRPSMEEIVTALEKVQMMEEKTLSWDSGVMLFPEGD